MARYFSLSMNFFGYSFCLLVFLGGRGEGERLHIGYATSWVKSSRLDCPHWEAFATRSPWILEVNW